MLRTSKGKGKKLTSEEEEIYEDDFEQFNDDVEEVLDDYDDDEEFFKKLGLDKDFVPEENYAEMSNTSESPCTDSAGEKLNTRSSSNHPHNLQLLTSFDEIDGTVYSFENESDVKYEFEREEDEASSANFNFRLFHQVIDDIPVVMKKKKYKNGTRASLTFSNERVKEIDRANKILLDKIMKHKFGPSGDGLHNNKSRSSSSASNSQRPLVKSAAEINRRKRQQKINYENAILHQKIEKIASRRRPLSSTLG